MEKEKEVRCQDCKYHTNRPSYCSNKKEYVGRKSKCESFNRK